MYLRAAALLCLLLVFLVGPAPSHAAPPPPGAVYLALGDALSYGSTAPGITPDPTCASAQAVGFVCIFYRYLKQINPQIQLKNLAVPDIDSCVLLNGYGGDSPCVNPVLAGRPAIPSPLAAAVQLIKSQPGQVNPITLNIGGGDLLPLLPNALNDPAGTAAKLPGVVRTFTDNLDIALSQLRAADPNGEILVVNQYNPLGGIGAPPLPAGLPDIARGAIENGLNGAMKSEAAKFNAVYVDVAAAFDANPGGAATLTFVPATLASGDPSKMDIYPTADGYQVMASAVIAASGYTLPLTVTAHLSSKKPKPRATVHVRGTTLPGASLSIAIHLPKAKARTLSATADTSGAFDQTFKTGKTSGKGTVTVCADTGGQKKCAPLLTFHVK